MKYWLTFLLALGLSACGHAQDPPPQTQQASRFPAPIQALVDKGLAIKGPLQAPSGYKGYLADYQGRPVPLYLLPDGKHAVVGTLFDVEGHDLTGGPMAATNTPALDAAVWKRLGESTWIAEGSKNPRRIVYEFTDTECPYCHKLWQATQPLLEGGDVQVRHIMVAVISPQSAGRAAAVLGSADPIATMHRHEKAFGHSPIAPLKDVPEATARRIRDNNALMQSLGIAGTPGTIYRDTDGKVRKVIGLPTPERIQEIFGP